MQSSSKSKMGTSGDWFERLFGFKECSDMEETRKNLTIQESPNGMILSSKVNGASYNCGEFSTPSLGEIREMALSMLAEEKSDFLKGEMKLVHEFGDIQGLIASKPNAVFQAASQFNCLEFVTELEVPECGVTGYSSDKTQGPACSVSCGPATVYRNYFAPVQQGKKKTQIGQSEECQINNIAEICDILGQPNLVKNGYTMTGASRLQQLNLAMEKQVQEGTVNELKDKLRIGLHRDVQVTSCEWGKKNIETGQRVTQIFGSACSITYSGGKNPDWALFASMILEASYEATLWAAVVHAIKHKNDSSARIVYLTALGGGVFGNEFTWIAKAIQDAADALRRHGIGLDLRIVSFRPPVEPNLLKLVNNFKQSGQMLQKIGQQLTWKQKALKSLNVEEALGSSADFELEKALQTFSDEEFKEMFEDKDLCDLFSRYGLSGDDAPRAKSDLQTCVQNWPEKFKEELVHLIADE